MRNRKSFEMIFANRVQIEIEFQISKRLCRNLAQVFSFRKIISIQRTIRMRTHSLENTSESSSFVLRFRTQKKAKVATSPTSAHRSVTIEIVSLMFKLCRSW